MNVLTATDLTADGLPVLRPAAAHEEEEAECLLSGFDGVEIHITVDESEDEVAGTHEELALNKTSGTLFVTTSRLLWVGDRSSTRVGYGWDVPQITLHAISRDPAAFPRPCLYCQIGVEEMTEVRFVPMDDKKQLQDMFTTLSKSAEMNPDEDEDEDDVYGSASGDMEGMDDGDGWIYNEEEVTNGARAAQIAAHLDSVLQIAPGVHPQDGQFDDADEDDSLL